MRWEKKGHEQGSAVRLGFALKEKWAETVTLCLCLILLTLFVSFKEGFHMDELLSFELANARFNPWIVSTQPEGRLAKFVREEIDGETLGETLGNLADTVKDVLENKGRSKLLSYQADVYEEPVWITAKQFQDYISVDGKDAFQYLSVYFNVKDDNHPPLHFMVLHTISSFFRRQATTWMGCLVNLIAVAVVLVLLMKICRLLLEALGYTDQKRIRMVGLCVAMLYGLSRGGHSHYLADSDVWYVDTLVYGIFLSGFAKNEEPGFSQAQYGTGSGDTGRILDPVFFPFLLHSPGSVGMCAAVCKEA